jgi:hypothetical protein
MPNLHQSVTSGAVGASPVYPERFTASRERLGRQAFPPVIALRSSVAHNPLSYALSIYARARNQRYPFSFVLLPVSDLLSFSIPPEMTNNI